MEQPEELIERISRGDRDALVDFYEQNRRSLLSSLWVMTADNGLAEDILQNTLYAVWTGVGRFQGRSRSRLRLF